MDNLIFFKHVFNIADSAITLGIVNIIIFQRRHFNNFHKKMANSIKIEDKNIVNENEVLTFEENHKEMV